MNLLVPIDHTCDLVRTFLSSRVFAIETKSGGALDCAVEPPELIMSSS